MESLIIVGVFVVIWGVGGALLLAQRDKFKKEWYGLGVEDAEEWKGTYRFRSSYPYNYMMKAYDKGYDARLAEMLNEKEAVDA